MLKKNRLSSPPSPPSTSTLPSKSKSKLKTPAAGDPSPAITMPMLNQRTTPCQSCRRARGRCVWIDGTDVCTTCHKRGWPCSGPTRITAMKCISCSNLKVKCQWLNDSSNICVRCHKMGKKCPGARIAVSLEQDAIGLRSPGYACPVVQKAMAASASSPSIGPNSASSRLFQTQLNLSLAWHCIQMCCSSNHVSFSGGDPAFYMNYYQLTRQMARRSLHIPFYEEVLTSLIIFAGATLSSHSALIGIPSAPTFLSLLAPSHYSLKAPSSFPVLSPQRTAALSSLSNTLTDHTWNFLQVPCTDFASIKQQLGLVRLVLSKATTVDAAWQAEVCETALLKGLSLLRSCNPSERDALLSLVRNFAFKSIINAAGADRQRLPLTRTDFELIFDPPKPFPAVTSEDIATYVFSPSSSQQTFIKYSWFGLFREIYNTIARIFFDLIQPYTTSTMDGIWRAVDEFRYHKAGLFKKLLEGLGSSNDARMRMRYSTIVRSYLAYEANYWKMALSARKILKHKGEATRERFREVVPGIADDVVLLLSLPTQLPRKLEVLAHQITLLLKIRSSELAQDFIQLPNPTREALLQGIKAFALTAKGPTAVELDAMIELLNATHVPSELDPKGEEASVSAIHVASATLDILRASSPPDSQQVTSLFVLVVDPVESEGAILSNDVQKLAGR